ncbi:Usa1p KNAG_0B03440 [Huiozyma naganishii CBS 8797]|uniref:Ubiquitin-like domain-containing protein n=1 Tax=Huiozyma naganishii (strain ATCC MYA-139 / BCRC 22969 / CBS 8797 / KCTC 17520 / NBRC 10181 / NCYC 3082 / Yp74L-3) TaxID=1071383 RepID=J7S4T4_HUIN7|nr:hypothetical protein KNAG_0B03440 [Kazachstania naganishii CBS 8797]CCK68786.1 hypothetical protein KNAG_0B03440 [Kazachstania naganishii CBS 8797]
MPEDDSVLLLEPPIQCSIYSSDLDLINTNISLNVHPKTKIYRLLQYVHFQVSKNQGYGTTDPLSDVSGESKQDLDSVRKFYLKYKDKICGLDTKLEDVDPLKESRASLEFCFERDTTANLVPEHNLDYDRDLEFNSVNVIFEVNMLSTKGPVHMSQKVNFPLSIRCSKLQKQVLDTVKSEEQTGEFCRIQGGHTINDFVAFKVKGADRSTDLVGDCADVFLDSALEEQLDINLLPTRHSTVVVMFYILHQLIPFDSNTHYASLELISDAKFFTNTMHVTKSTTVLDVKRYISQTCNTYALNVPLDEIKLVYKGQKVHEKNYAGQDALITDYTRDDLSAAVHVQLMCTSGTKIDTFWVESLIREKEALHPCMPLEQTSSSVDVPATSDSNAKPPQEAHTSEVDDESINSVPQTPEGDTVETLTTIDPTIVHYIKCLTPDGTEVFLEANRSEALNVTLEVEGFKFSLSSYQYTITDKYVEIDDSILRAVEGKLGMDIEEDRTADVVQGGGDQVQTWDVTMLRHLRTAVFFCILVGKTVWMVFSGTFFLFIFLFELSIFVPLKYLCILAFCFGIRNIMSRPEIYTQWVDFFHLDAISKRTLTSLKQFLDRRDMPKYFYKSVAENDEYINVFSIPPLRTCRLDLYWDAGINCANGRVSADCLQELFGKVANGEFPASSMTVLLRKLMEVYETQPRIFQEDAALRKSTNGIFELIRDEQEYRSRPGLPLYKRVFQSVLRNVRNLAPSYMLQKLLEKVVPDPEHDYYIVGALKNMTLFLLLLVPGLNTFVDKVVEEYTERRKQREREMAAATAAAATAAAESTARARSEEPAEADSADSPIERLPTTTGYGAMTTGANVNVGGSQDEQE